MLNYLMLGWYANVFKQDPLVRIYVNDQFIDEYNIKNNIESKDFKIFNYDHNSNGIQTLEPKQSETKKIERLEKIPCQNKILVIDDHNKSELEIKIEIKNSFSNYTNGFVTKQTLVHLHHLFFVNEKLVNNIEKIEKRYKYFFDTSRKTHVKRYLISQRMRNRRKQIYQDFSIDSEKNFNNVPKEDEKTSNLWAGGNGYFKIKLKKRFGFWTSQDNVHGIWKLGERTLVQYIRNKYLHEN